MRGAFASSRQEASISISTRFVPKILISSLDSSKAFRYAFILAFRATCPPQSESSKIDFFVVLVFAISSGDSLASLGENKICIFTLFCYDFGFWCVCALIAILADFTIKGII